jgi:hypothetical protein
VDCQEAKRANDIIEKPARAFDPTGMFWLDPAVIQDVDLLINNTTLPTMSLGAETHAAEMHTAWEQIKDMLIPEGDPLTKELVRALDVGYMYGRLIAARSNEHKASEPEGQAPQQFDHALSESLGRGMQRAVEGLDLSCVDDNYLLFMRLRKVEVEQANSDILAFSLAAVQDHMVQEFDRFHGSLHLTRDQTYRLQSMFYAGALVGSLLSSDPEDLDKPTVEVMRTTQGSTRTPAVRLEFDQEDNLVEAVDIALGSKLVFQYVNDESQKQNSYIAIVPSGIQFAPNMLSLPIFIPGMEEPELIMKVPIDQVDALIVANQEPESGQVKTFSLIAEPQAYLDDPETSLNSKVVGVLMDEGCYGAYDKAHPNSQVIREMAALWSSVEPEMLKYEFEMKLADAPTSESNFGKIAVAGAALPWLFDVVTLAGSGESSIHWQTDAGMDVVILAGVGILAAAKRILKKRI